MFGLRKTSLVYEQLGNGRDLLPEFSLEFFPSGETTYQGKANVAVKGRRQLAVDVAKARALFAGVEAMGFASLKLEGVAWLPGSIKRRLTRIHAGAQHSVTLRHAAGRRPAALDALEQLEKQMLAGIDLAKLIERETIGYSVYPGTSDYVPQLSVRVFSDGEVVLNLGSGMKKTHIDGKRASALVERVAALDLREIELDEIKELRGKPKRQLLHFRDSNQSAVLGKRGEKDIAFPPSAPLGQLLAIEREILEVVKRAR
jgi:hypothetical protein